MNKSELLLIFTPIFWFWIATVIALLTQIISEYKEYKKHKED